MIKTLKQLRDDFWATHTAFTGERRTKKRQNEYKTDIRCAFVDFVDYLQKDGLITEALAKRATL